MIVFLALEYIHSLVSQFVEIPGGERGKGARKCDMEDRMAVDENCV